MIYYDVEFSDIAESELIDSIIWRIGVWGEESTFRWARDFRDKTRTQLSKFPQGQPLAPESEIDEGEIRHLVLGRYRVLFEITGKMVNILHITGSFSDKD